MNEQQSITDSGATILSQITHAIASNPNIWIPVLGAWACGFIFTRYLNGHNAKRRADREFRVYMINFWIALVLYVLFNSKSGFDVYMPQAVLSGAVAVLLPAVWFWWQKSKGSKNT